MKRAHPADRQCIPDSHPPNPPAGLDLVRRKLTMYCRVCNEEVCRGSETTLSGCPKCREGSR